MPIKISAEENILTPFDAFLFLFFIKILI